MKNLKNTTDDQLQFENPSLKEKIAELEEMNKDLLNAVAIKDDQLQFVKFTQAKQAAQLQHVMDLLEKAYTHYVAPALGHDSKPDDVSSPADKMRFIEHALAQSIKTTTPSQMDSNASDQTQEIVPDTETKKKRKKKKKQATTTSSETSIDMVTDEAPQNALTRPNDDETSPYWLKAMLVYVQDIITQNKYAEHTVLTIPQMMDYIRAIEPTKTLHPIFDKYLDCFPVKTVNLEDASFASFVMLYTAHIVTSKDHKTLPTAVLLVIDEEVIPYLFSKRMPYPDERFGLYSAVFKLLPKLMVMEEKQKRRAATCERILNTPSELDAYKAVASYIQTVHQRLFENTIPLYAMANNDDVTLTEDAFLCAYKLERTLRSASQDSIDFGKQFYLRSLEWSTETPLLTQENLDTSIQTLLLKKNKLIDTYVTPALSLNDMTLRISVYLFFIESVRHLNRQNEAGLLNENTAIDLCISVLNIYTAQSDNIPPAPVVAKNITDIPPMHTLGQASIFISYILHIYQIIPSEATINPKTLKEWMIRNDEAYQRMLIAISPLAVSDRLKHQVAAINAIGWVPGKKILSQYAKQMVNYYLEHPEFQQSVVQDLSPSAASTATVFHAYPTPENGTNKVPPPTVTPLVPHS